MCLCHPLAKERQFSIKTRADQWVNKDLKTVWRKEIITNWTHHAIITLLYWWNTPRRQKIQTNNKSIWIVTNVLLVAILFHFPHAPPVQTHDGIRFWVFRKRSHLIDLLLTPLCLLLKSWIILFAFHWSRCHDYKLAIRYSLMIF